MPTQKYSHHLIFLNQNNPLSNSDKDRGKKKLTLKQIKNSGKNKLGIRIRETAWDIPHMQKDQQLNSSSNPINRKRNQTSVQRKDCQI
jgi:hypothetical protein